MTGTLQLFVVATKNTDSLFHDSSECLVFSESDILIKKFIVKDAKALAQAKNSRLVYLNKNKDGLCCFKLQPLPDITESLTPDDANEAVDSLKTKKTNEESSKEFKIKSSIKEHDLSIKMTKIKSLLTKGKSVKIIIQHSVSESDTIGQAFSKKLMDELKKNGKLITEASGKGITRFTVVPVTTQPSS
ncbi:hypothetical protein Btru_024145 [Bulinus truncatus]|nr:hypothetical protein Btru_024145 [Bulinus truncatus]